ncbi:MAG: helix-turn-helix domain-containing protein [bacterium]
MKTWLTVKQVAEYLQLSTMMVYKLAQKGEIPAAKIGSAWRFDRDEIDAWLSPRGEGRAPDSTREIPGKIRDVVDRYLKNLREAFGARFSRLLVFGSWARGRGGPDSDIDCLVLLTKTGDRDKDFDAAVGAAYSAGFDHEPTFVIAPLVMTEHEFSKGSSPLIMNIRREGLEVFNLK